MQSRGRFVRRIIDGFLFITVTVILAKVAQYAVVDHLGRSIGFAAASFIGAAPVIAAAALVDRHWRAPRSHLARTD